MNYHNNTIMNMWLDVRTTVPWILLGGIIASHTSSPPGASASCVNKTNSAQSWPCPGQSLTHLSISAQYHHWLVPSFRPSSEAATAASAEAGAERRWWFRVPLVRTMVEVSRSAARERMPWYYLMIILNEHLGSCWLEFMIWAESGWLNLWEVRDIQSREDERDWRDLDMNGGN